MLNAHLQRYSDEEVLTCLQQIANGKPLSLAAYERARQGKKLKDGRAWPSGQQAHHRWGSWNAALKQAGLPTNPRPHQTGSRWTNDAILVAIQTIAKDLGRFPTATQYDETARTNSAMPSLSTVRVRFGSWSAATKAAQDQT